jgi:hypothetical protein
VWAHLSKIAVFYIVTLGCTFSAFVWCSQSLRRIPITTIEGIELPKETSTKDDPQAIKDEGSFPMTEMNKDASQVVVTNEDRGSTNGRIDWRIRPALKREEIHNYLSQNPIQLLWHFMDPIKETHSPLLASLTTTGLQPLV